MSGLVPGAAAPKVVTTDMVRRIKPGSVIVDVAIDQGGYCETSHPTAHDDPTYVVDGVIHYCVANNARRGSPHVGVHAQPCDRTCVFGLAERGM